MKIPNKTAKLIVSRFGKIGLLVVGSYARSSHQKDYKDLDFISLKPLSKIAKILNIQGDFKDRKFIYFKLDDKYTINIWKATKSNLYKIYMQRYLPAYKQIYINKILKITKNAANPE